MGFREFGLSPIIDTTAFFGRYKLVLDKSKRAWNSTVSFDMGCTVNHIRRPFAQINQRFLSILYLTPQKIKLSMTRLPPQWNYAFIWNEFICWFVLNCFWCYCLIYIYGATTFNINSHTNLFIAIFLEWNWQMTDNHIIMTYNNLWAFRIHIHKINIGLADSIIYTGLNE